MKPYILTTLLLLFLSVEVFSQQPNQDVRTNETKIADLLMRLPATNSNELDQIMAQFQELGGEAIINIARNLVAPGKGNDANFRYAISGIAKYASEADDPAYTRQCAEALGKAISASSNDEVKDFLLQELQYVAGDESVSLAFSLLEDERLTDPAARVLIRINSEKSRDALFSALSEANDETQQIIMLQAIGNMRYQSALDKLNDLAATTTGKVKKVVLRSIAQLGNPGSMELLASEAEKVNYAYDPVEATTSYLLLINQLADSNGEEVAKACGKIIKNKEVPLHIKTAALRTLTQVEGQDAYPALSKALKSSDKEFRMSAISLLAEIYSTEVAADLKKITGKTKKPELKSELIYLFEQQKDNSALPLVMQMLDASDKQVLQASISAAANIGKKEAISPLMEKMNSADNEMVPVIKTALLTIEGEEVPNTAAAFIPNASGSARVALIDIIAHRKAVGHKSLIFQEAEKTDAQVALAAARALANLVNQGDEQKVAVLINETKDQEKLQALQHAMYMALDDYDDQSTQVAATRKLMMGSGEKAANYYPVLARIGGDQALDIVKSEYEKSVGEQQDQALQALCKWSDYAALDYLFQIAENSSNQKYAQMALSSYVEGINQSNNSADQKVLMFRKAMTLTDSKELTVKILDGVSENSSLQALTFVAGYFNNSELQQEAIQAVRSIVLSNADLYGPVVEQIIGDAIRLNRHREADYQKAALQKHLESLPDENGFVSLFNGKNLQGWQGLVENPIKRSTMSAQELEAKQNEANQKMQANWKVRDGILIYEGDGFDNLTTKKEYDDFELILDWKASPNSDAGLYLRGTPQVQIWDAYGTAKGAEVGSGGLFNNQKFASKPLLVADNPTNTWNTFRIIMVDDKVTVYLNGELVVDNVILENYWDREQPIFEKGPIELQAHATKVEYRDIFIREIPRPEPYVLEEEEKDEGFVPLFNGTDLTGWIGNKVDYFARDGMIICQPTGQKNLEALSGNLYTEKPYSDFILRFEFQLTPGANNGLGIRTPTQGDAAYIGMELQILDNDAEIYKNLKPYQYHGSVYGVIPAKRGFQKPIGEWNYQEVQARGNHIKVILNGEVILDGNIAEASKNGTETVDHRDHPGLLNESGHIGFLGHGSPLKFRNIRIKDLSE